MSYKTVEKPVIRARKCDRLKNWIYRHTDVFNDNYRKAVQAIKSDNKEYHGPGDRSNKPKNSSTLADQLPCFR